MAEGKPGAGAFTITCTIFVAPHPGNAQSQRPEAKKAKIKELRSGGTNRRGTQRCWELCLFAGRQPAPLKTPSEVHPHLVAGTNSSPKECDDDCARFCSRIPDRRRRCLVPLALSPAAGCNGSAGHTHVCRPLASPLRTPLCPVLALVGRQHHSVLNSKDYFKCQNSEEKHQATPEPPAVAQCPMSAPTSNVPDAAKFGVGATTRQGAHEAQCPKARRLQ